MDTGLFKVLLVLCMNLDTPEYNKVHPILIDNCDKEAKSRGFTGWVDAYHRAVPKNVRLGN